MTVLLVAAGGAAGAVLRMLLATALHREERPLPLGTLAANVLASLGLGMLLAADPGPVVGAALGAGLAGGLSTWSTHAAETDRLALTGARRVAVVNVLATVGMCLAAVAAGAWAGTRLGAPG